MKRFGIAERAGYADGLAAGREIAAMQSHSPEYCGHWSELAGFTEWSTTAALQLQSMQALLNQVAAERDSGTERMGSGSGQLPPKQQSNNPTKGTA